MGTFSPDNPGFVARRDYQGDIDASSRTLNFILPADFTPATNRMELWIDASACAGWTNNQIWNSKNHYLNDFIFAQEPEPARPLRIGDYAIIRSGTVIYANTTIGHRFQCGHHVLIRAEVTIGELVEMVIALVGRPVKIELDPLRLRPVKSEVMRLISNNSKAQAKLGWQPQVGLREGLGQTVAWIRENLHLYRPGEYQV